MTKKVDIDWNNLGLNTLKLTSVIFLTGKMENGMMDT